MLMVNVVHQMMQWLLAIIKNGAQVKSYFHLQFIIAFKLQDISQSKN